MDIIEVIKSNISSYTKSQKKISDYILKHYFEVSFMTIKDLAVEIKTSTTSIVRFVETIGFSGYSDFQKALREYISKDQTPKTRLSRNELKRMKFGHNSFENIMNVNLDNIESLSRMNEDSHLKEIVELINQADKVHCGCLRSGIPVGHYLVDGINRTTGKAEMINMNYWIYEFDKIKPDDVVILISFPRYMKEVLHLAQTLKEHSEATIISITDNSTSPIVEMSDYCIYTDTNSMGFHNNPIAAMVVTDYLITELTFMNLDEIKNRIDVLNSITEKYKKHIK